MGTRSVTRVHDKSGCILSMYAQYDGYPNGMGQELLDFINSKPFVNGIGSDSNVFNGAGCFAAQLVAHFKKEAGGFYLTHPKDSQDYDYDIYFDYTGEGFERAEKVTRITVSHFGKLIFDGAWENFQDCIDNPE